MLLAKYLTGLDQGTLSDLVGDLKVVELIREVSQNRQEHAETGDLILKMIGGASAILDSSSKRQILLLSLSRAQRAGLADYLQVRSLDRLEPTTTQRKALYEYFGEKLEESDGSVNEQLAAASLLKPKYALFSHQVQALEEAKRHLVSRPPRVMLHMPTGSGKTRTAMHLVSHVLNSHQNAVVVWLVAGRELCQQAAEEFQTAWSSLGDRELPIVRLWGGLGAPDVSLAQNQEFIKDKWPLNLKDGFVVGSVDTLRNITESWEPAARVSRRNHIRLIVFDEAHRAVADTYLKTIQRLLYDHTALIGLSATPGRRHYGEELSADKILVNLFAGQKVTLKIGEFDSPVDGLIHEGYLANLKKEQLPIASNSLSSKQLVQLQRALEAQLDLPGEMLRAFGLNATRNLQIVNRIEKLIRDEKHRRVIIFAPSVESSLVISHILSAREIRAFSITNQTPVDIRERTIKKFKSDDPEPLVLTNYGVLTTGFDAPQTSAVLIARPTTSIVLLNQMAGRAIRGPRVGGNADALLITVVDTQVPELVESNRQFHAFDESWKSTEETKYARRK